MKNRNCRECGRDIYLKVYSKLYVGIVILVIVITAIPLILD